MIDFSAVGSGRCRKQPSAFLSIQACTGHQNNSSSPLAQASAPTYCDPHTSKQLVAGGLSRVAQDFGQFWQPATLVVLVWTANSSQTRHLGCNCRHACCNACHADLSGSRGVSLVSAAARDHSNRSAPGGCLTPRSQPSTIRCKQSELTD